MTKVNKYRLIKFQWNLASAILAAVGTAWELVALWRRKGIPFCKQYAGGDFINTQRLDKDNRKKTPELFGSSGDFVYLCSRVIILGEGVRPFLW